MHNPTISQDYGGDRNEVGKITIFLNKEGSKC